MRIQHNVMAMNAYRNYSNNISAMKKNLERLSSGYKINRAGDDAAGLAISEKMRAQITGLETASKNAKDGISLVQTAEGALTEVHDMLNRMVELATQSANGTYDNDTDRLQLQKEMDQLMEEINRIADSSNFNGIKLLDGSMDISSISGVKYDAISDNKVQKLFVNQEDWITENGDQPAVDADKNILETEGGTSSKASFQINLDNLKLTNVEAGEKFTLTIGGYDVVATLAEGGDYTSAMLAQALDGKTWTCKDSNDEEHTFTISANGSVLTFNIDEDDTTEFSLKELGDVTWALGSGTVDPKSNVKSPDTDVKVTANSMEVNLAGLKVYEPGDITIVVGKNTRDIAESYEFTITITASDIIDKEGNLNFESVGAKLEAAMKQNAAFMTAVGSDATFEIGKDGLITITTKNVTLNPTEWEGYKTTAKEASASSGAGGPGGAETYKPIGIKISGGTNAIAFGSGSSGGYASIAFSLASMTVEGLTSGAAWVTVSFGSGDAVQSFHFQITASDVTAADGSVGTLLAEKLKKAIGENTFQIGSKTFALASSTGASILFKAKEQGTWASVPEWNSFTIKEMADGAEIPGSKGIEPRVVRAGVIKGFTDDVKTPETRAVTITMASEASVASIGFSVATATAALDLTNVTKFTFSVGGDDYDIFVVASAADAPENVEFGENGISLDGKYILVTASQGIAAASIASVAQDKLLTALGTALQQQLDDVVKGKASGTSTYTSYLINDVTVASDGLGLKVTFTPTEHTYSDGNGSGEEKELLKPVSILDGTAAANVDFADKENLEKGLNDLDPGLLTALKEAGDNGKISLVDGEDDLVLNLSELLASYTGSEALSKLLDDIEDEVTALCKAWNAAHPDSDFDYEFDHFESGGVTIRAAGDGLQIVLAKVTREGGGGDGDNTKGGYINGGIQNPHDNVTGASAQVANTVVDFGDYWKDGAKITIGDTTYTVALGQDSKFKNVTNAIDLTDLTSSDANLGKIAAQRLAAAAKDNGIFSVGHDGEGHTTLQQLTSAKDSTDMSTKEKLASYLGVSIADANSITTAKPGAALTLQIGDTADSYNQLKVSIGDCHTAALGLDGISIADQDSAAAAIDKIKAAINTVSDVRGTLGATQNRLDHTINNLSVMTENIQDAESTIRDTDIAEEMMAYTKNNILIQAAQAMLAQANQVPQGVLQLLQ